MTALWLFPSTLVPRGGAIFRRYVGVGKECWKCAGAGKVGSSCAGGQFGICCHWCFRGLLFFGDLCNGESTKAKQWSECTPVVLARAFSIFFFFFFRFQPKDPRCLGISGHTMTGGSGSDALAQKPAIKGRSRCRSDFPPDAPETTGQERGGWKLL